MGAVHLHAVKSGLDGARAGVAEVLDNAGNLVEFQRAGRRNVDKALAGHEGLGVRPDGRRTDGRLAVLLEAGVGDTARMPELHDDFSAFGVHGVGDFFPAPDLIVGIATRRVGVALRLRRDLRGLCDNQAGRGALGVIGNGERTRDQARSRRDCG